VLTVSLREGRVPETLLGVGGNSQAANVPAGTFAHEIQNFFRSFDPPGNQMSSICADSANTGRREAINPQIADQAVCDVGADQPPVPSSSGSQSSRDGSNAGAVRNCVSKLKTTRNISGVCFILAQSGRW
jgi:hypothetical protein